MNDEDFADLVNRDVKRIATFEESGELRRAENRQRWGDVLAALQREAADALEELDGEPVAEARRLLASEDRYVLELGASLLKEVQRRRGEEERWARKIDAAMAERERLMALDECRGSAVPTPADFYAAAITRHRESLVAFGVKPGEADLALWESLAGKWAFTNLTSAQRDEES